MMLPDWINRDLYPFEPKSLETDAGEMSYVDVGEGPVVLCLHGNPTWSFMYREVLKRLRDEFRCIAPDYIGFGLSDKPEDWGYRPWDHANVVQTLLDHLDVEAFHLVVHDWGGPIGLSLALDDPDRLESLTVMNTWMWSLSDRLDSWMFSRFLGSSLGRYLISDWDLFTDLVMKWGVASPGALEEEVHRHYRAPYEGGGSKRGVWQFPTDILEADDWLRGLWERRESIADKPALVTWGMKDPAFDDRQLNRWLEILDDVRVRRYDDSSHYLMEDQGESVSSRLEEFLREIR